jgi:hypothetical protein
MAVDLAKLSLWLATLARNHPFTFLDHSLRHGDSLVGLTRQQIATFHWLDKQSVLLDLERDLRERIARGARCRQQILSARDDVPYARLKQQLDGADESFQAAREVGDTIIAAFFSAEKAKDREDRRLVLRELTETARRDPTARACEDVEKAVAGLRSGRKGIVPFHWELEFPEVFTTDDKGRVDGGFDVIFGNPPFAGKNTLISATAENYPDWLKQVDPGSHGNADLVAHFFRRVFSLLRPAGCLGLIATNTIGQGDTRSSGLKWICNNGGTIYRATKRVRWPGEAAVIVSVVHVYRGELRGPFLLDGRQVGKITAYLFHSGSNEDPFHLEANSDKSFAGSFILGMGFTFDDTDSKGVASPILEMKRLIASDPRNAERIFPFIGGEEVNTSPTQSHHRYVINFDDFPRERKLTGHSWFELNEETQRQQLRQGVVAHDYPRPVAADWPELLEIVERKVKPQREGDNRENYRRLWWQYAERRPGMYRACSDNSRVLVQCRISSWLSFVLLKTGAVFDISLNVFPLNNPLPGFAVLQSRVHELWARFLSSSMKDDMRYTPSDCFETFPLPRDYEPSANLEEIGTRYYDFRARVMTGNNEGLTTTYNRFHDPNEDASSIVRLRELHEVMDRAVLDAYGWTEIQPNCEFIPEFDDEDDEDENGRCRKKKYRYRWPDEIRDEVLARLLELNRQRALEEGQVVLDDTGALPDAKVEKTKSKKAKTKKAKQVSSTDQITMNLGKA